MRLGGQECSLTSNSKSREIYAVPIAWWRGELWVELASHKPRVVRTIHKRVIKIYNKR
jgi:hypothetical protein